MTMLLKNLQWKVIQWLNYVQLLKKRLRTANTAAHDAATAKDLALAASGRC